jgi:hypothetical protein
MNEDIPVSEQRVPSIFRVQELAKRREMACDMGKGKLGKGLQVNQREAVALKRAALSLERKEGNRD